ncbi:MAG: S41 family peptidase [Gemmatimonadales bacterium]
MRHTHVRTSTLLVSFGLLATFWIPPASAQEAAPNPWAVLTRGDLAAIHQTLLENHPGPVDPLNPGYRRWFDDGYRRALAMADSVENLDGLRAVLSFYTSGFDDGHLGWGLSAYRRTAVQWPGFVVALRDGRFLVDHVASWVTAEALVPGAEVMACDGRDLHERLVDDVMTFQEGIASLQASRVRLAPRVFVDDQNPFVNRPERCRVRDAASDAPREVELNWRWIYSTSMDSLVARAAYGSGVDDYQVLHPAGDVAWITIPSFQETREGGREGLERLVAAMPGLRDNRLIVFDVRGNRGGNSAWAHRLLAPLFGESYVDSVEAKVGDDEYVEWRASTGNADFVEESSVPRYEPGSENREYLERLVAALREAVAAGRDLVRIDADDESASGEATSGPSEHPLGRHVILLTDGWCASACLDFADELLAIPGVRHAGAATYADAVYIDNRAIQLPSQLGRFGFSMKVYRNRPRGQNEPYVPDLEYTGESWELGALQEWLLRVAR